jgi:sugar O-acyltransferase (sialic acid O-acetyltransferase NeuD family)
MTLVLGIYCAGSLGKELYDLASRINDSQIRWTNIVFIDDVCAEKEFYGTEVHRLDEYNSERKNIEFIIANGTPVHRKMIYDKIVSRGFAMTNLIDPTVIISPTAKVGKGVIMKPYAQVTSEALIEDNVMIHYYVAVGHDCIIRKHSCLSTNVCIGGKAVVGKETYVGMGAIIKEDITIGDNVIISMGAVAHTDIKSDVIAVGNPARVVKFNENGRVFKG